jgi:ribonuclease HI
LGHGAGAAVLRNNEGVVVVAQAKWYGPITDALEAEVMAARDGLLLAKKLVISDVVLETDCSVLVKALPNDSMAGP